MEPARAFPGGSWQSEPGARPAAIAVVLWVAATLLLRVYRGHFSSSRLYGGMSAVITLLLWLYFTGAAILIGGEANSEIEKAAAAAGHPDMKKARERPGGGSPGR